jgi:hypothetical protein
MRLPEIASRSILSFIAHKIRRSGVRGLGHPDEIPTNPYQARARRVTHSLRYLPRSAPPAP